MKLRWVFVCTRECGWIFRDQENEHENDEEFEESFQPLITVTLPCRTPHPVHPAIPCFSE